MVALGTDLGKEIADSLGLKRVTALDIRIRAKEPVTVTATQYVERVQAKQIAEKIGRYTLTKEASGNPFPVLSDFDNWFDWEVAHA